jgi:uncharacterized glyoxalase superfamily metalloenzyme YdcJ
MAPSATPDAPASHPDWADCDQLRTDFTLAMSAMYKGEVPLYGDLVRLVAGVNASTRLGALDPEVLAMRTGDVSPERLDIERHGAIRLGTAAELQTIRRVFALIGLFPVGYYDLAPAGLPMHATCFRPRSRASLRRNPFRVFTSVLRPDLIRNAEARSLALGLLAKRNIFSPELLRLLELGDVQGGCLTLAQGRTFVAEAMKTFGWHGTAAATQKEYLCLKREHPILADIACFHSAHINHLTPRTLDITAAQETMKKNGFNVKDRVEGPPPRSCPILLRQTSFLAIEEPIEFLAADDKPGSPLISGSHKARFGEIEERGAAVTPAGRKLYDELLNEAMLSAQSKGSPPTAAEVDELLVQTFQRYPDDWCELRRRGLIYCSYRCTEKGLSAQLAGQKYTLEALVADGVIEALPVTYEDFLPLSAAGIFQSNLGSTTASETSEGVPDLTGMEEALGVTLEDSDLLYRSMEQTSIGQCASALGIELDG